MTDMMIDLNMVQGPCTPKSMRTIDMNFRATNETPDSPTLSQNTKLFNDEYA
jgi:hypothetical protein